MKDNFYNEDKIRFVKIVFANLELACEIQNKIFPEEDARQNFIEQLNKDPYRKEMDYYIVYTENVPIGVTGIYSYNELGIKNCRFYDLRGSYATRILKNGVEIRDVADILGHKNIETTENYYISSSTESRKEANDIFEKLIHSEVIDRISNYKY